MSKRGERRVIRPQGKKPGKSDKQRIAELEQRLAKWTASAAEDLVRLRSMLAAAVEAMEAHDVTIAAQRLVLKRRFGDKIDDEIDAARKEILDKKSEVQRKNQELADRWNAQLARMREEGVPEDQLREIFAQARREMVEPEIIRAKLDQGAAPEVPDGAFEFGIT